MSTIDPLAETEVPDLTGGPLAISVEGLSKSFRIPLQKVESIKERAVHPFRRQEARQLDALKDISFEVHRGEFFGIVGRNGSGKSTLLKVLASIYKADSGRVRIAGRLAPFIELGVGFNPDLTAFDNVVMNGVMMGLSREDAAARLGRVVEFAELEEFTELKLKNYSSGMMVRLAFSLMMQADADVMLIDEVLAVGDASFQQKCHDAFNGLRDAGKTIVLVTHDMGAVEAFCHRALLIEAGEIIEQGEPREVARMYMKKNFESTHKPAPEVLGYVDGGEVADDFVPDVDVQARTVDAWLSDGSGGRIENVEIGSPLNLNVIFEAIQDLPRPLFTFQIANASHIQVTGVNKTLGLPEEDDLLPAGSRVTISGSIENPLAPGRYQVTCWVTRERGTSERVVQGLNVLEFVVFGMKRTPGLIEIESDLNASIEGPGGE